jgi:NTE family protein
MSASDQRKPVTVALQGGGAHGAFTWGVLDQLLSDRRLRIEGISGTSAGAMNGTMVAEGFRKDGAEGARQSLERFWREISAIGRFGPFARTPLDSMVNPAAPDHTPGYMLFDAVSRYLSPYQFNPLNYNPLLEVLRSRVDFARVRACVDLNLFVAATNVRTGKVRIFRREELTADMVMASAALPNVFQAVEIEGDPYWDGGYMGNPAIFPLIYECDTADVILVQINPTQRDETPTTTPEIQDRLNEITFNATLMREMRAIAFVTRLLDEGRLDGDRYKRMYMHRVAMPDELSHLSVASKFNAEWSFLTNLRDLGRRQAAAWLDQHFHDIGQRSSLDIEAEYL